MQLYNVILSACIVAIDFSGEIIFTEFIAKRIDHRQSNFPLLVKAA